MASGISPAELPPPGPSCPGPWRIKITGETFHAYDATGQLFAFGYCYSHQHQADLWLALQRSRRSAAVWRGEPLDCPGTHQWWWLAEDIDSRFCEIVDDDIDVPDEHVKETAALLRELIRHPGSLGDELIYELISDARPWVLHDCLRLIRRHTRGT